MPDYFITCSAGYERFLQRELAAIIAVSGENSGDGWIEGTSAASGDFAGIANVKSLCFARYVLEIPAEFRVIGSRDFTSELCNYFCASLRMKRIETAWPILFESVDHQSSQEKCEKMAMEFQLKLRKAVSRVAKFAVHTHALPRGVHEGLFVFFVKDRALVSTRCWSGGQWRMKMIPGAPSRSYLKIEEAFTIIGTAPCEGETVIDLGASPGGWSFSASEHGARVYAVDNGPLKEGAANNIRIEHLREDAFNFVPPHHAPADWLLCDMVEDPDRVIVLLEKWVKSRWCKRFVANLKFGHTDPVALVSRVRDGSRGLISYCQDIIVSHLHHDREELTVMGRVG